MIESPTPPRPSLPAAEMLDRGAAGAPLRIDELAWPGGGVIGLSHFPGRCGVDGRGRHWRRDVSADLHSICEWGAAAVLSLVEAEEFARYGTPDLGLRVRALGLRWHHLPVPDMGVLAGGGALVQQPELAAVRAALQSGERVLVHCAAGLGRTGTVVAGLLVVQGSTPQQAIEAVRGVRPGTLETAQQEAWVHALGAADAAGRSASPQA
jgi:ADP-ribosyl-[dinitrogen reductase] hydrolase